ncbi:MAG TPA: DUF1003 domain-containing protein [Flavipsychrobacter sp.]|nr:DUF1003 domain-containing protein [Flavipsychrobacter sp.]
MSQQKNMAQSLDELRKVRKPHELAMRLQDTNVSFVDKLALWITNNVGSMKFFIIIFTWTILWLGWNMLAPQNMRFDPFPAFVLWLFISNMIQLFLMPLIMVGQNLQSRQADFRAKADYEINKRAELEIETILMHLEYQNKIILEILDDIKKKE